MCVFDNIYESVFLTIFIVVLLCLIQTDIEIVAVPGVPHERGQSQERESPT